MRAGRLVTASRPRAGQGSEHGRHQYLIGPHQNSQNELHPGYARIEARSASRNHSAFIPVKRVSTALFLATITIQHPSFRRLRVHRTSSRIRRLTLLRTTAFPSPREVMMPTRASPGAASLSTPRIRFLPAIESPSSLTRLNSAVRVSLAVFGNREIMTRNLGWHRRFSSSLRMTRVRNFGAARIQAFPSFLSPAGNNGAATSGLHTCTETILPLPRTFRRLVSSFHDSVPAFRLELRGTKLAAQRDLSNQTTSRPSCPKRRGTFACRSLLCNKRLLPDQGAYHDTGFPLRRTRICAC